MNTTQINIRELGTILNYIEQLRIISRKLRKMFVNDCNYGNTDRRDKAEQKLIDKAHEIAEIIHYKIYVQGDPRGVALYLVEDEHQEYTNGIALY